MFSVDLVGSHPIMFFYWLHQIANDKPNQSLLTPRGLSVNKTYCYWRDTHPICGCIGPLLLSISRVFQHKNQAPKHYYITLMSELLEQNFLFCVSILLMAKFLFGAIGIWRHSLHSYLTHGDRSILKWSQTIIDSIIFALFKRGACCHRKMQNSLDQYFL